MDKLYIEENISSNDIIKRIAYDYNLSNYVVLKTTCWNYNITVILFLQLFFYIKKQRVGNNSLSKKFLN